METAKAIMKTIAEYGHEVYIVGGAVRDFLRGERPGDIDIATSAAPAEIAKIGRTHGWRVLAIGEAFGVMAVIANGRQYEVASFRSECYGEDCHRPKEVELGVGLAADLARRDFTINAMAMDLSGNVVDLFGGQADLAAGIIRAVGKPEERFAEDALRMFRAVRFAAQLGFSVAADILAAIPLNIGRVAGLSVERVRVEIEKTLLAGNAAGGFDIMLRTGLLAAVCQTRNHGQTTPVPILPELMLLSGLKQNPRHHVYDVWQHTLAALRLVPANLTLRWAALLHDVAKGWPSIRVRNKEGQPSDPGHDKAGAQAAAVIMDRLKVNGTVVQRVSWLIRQHLICPAPQRAGVLNWLKRLSTDFKNSDKFIEALEELFALHTADRLAGHTCPDIEGLNEVRSITTELMREIPFFPAQLAVTGGEIAQKLGPGPQVACFQQNLLMRIQAGQLTNTRVSLFAAVNARAQRLINKTK